MVLFDTAAAASQKPAAQTVESFEEDNDGGNRTTVNHEADPTNLGAARCVNLIHSMKTEHSSRKKVGDTYVWWRRDTSINRILVFPQRTPTPKSEGMLDAGRHPLNR